MSALEDPNSLSSVKHSEQDPVDAKIKKRKRLLYLAKYRAIDILNGGNLEERSEENIFRARTSLLSDFINWKIYKKGDATLTILIAVSNEEFTEEFINDLD
jgi:hypothetical protein